MTSAAPMQPAETRADQVTGHGAGQAALRPQGSTGEAERDSVVLSPRAAAQRRLQAAADRSAQSVQLHTFRRIARDSARTLQLQAMHAGMHAPVDTRQAPTPDGRPLAVIQRVVAQILPDLAAGGSASSDREADDDAMEEDTDNDVVIGRLAIVGRPDSPYSGTMGDHSTAYTALQVGLETRLSGLTVNAASELLKELSYELLELPGWRLVKHMPREQQVLAETAWQVLEDIIEYFDGRRAAGERDGSDVGRMQEFIEMYLQFHEYLPLSTINTRYLGAATAGKGKGESAHALAGAENDPESASTDGIKAAARSLFDPRTAALVALIDDQTTMDKVAPGLRITTSSEERIDMMIESHLMLLESLYPQATDKLKNQEESGDEDVSMEEKKEEDEGSGLNLWDELADELRAAVGACVSALKSGTAEKSRKKVARSTGDGKRYAAASVFMDQGHVVAVKIAGRPVSPFSGTMGAHTTAFVVYRDLIESQLRGKSLAGASATLLRLMHTAREDLAAALRIFPADGKQLSVINGGLDMLQEIEGALGEVEAGADPASAVQEEERKEMEADEAHADGAMSEWEQVLVLQEGIVRLVDIYNTTPGATLDIADINGKREGAHRAELMSADKPDRRKRAILGLLDMAGIGDYLETSRENMGDEEEDEARDAYFAANRSAYPDEDAMPEASGDEEAAQLHIIRHHLKAISLAYPGKMQDTGLEGELDDDALKLLVEESLALRKEEAEYLGDEGDD